ncbi:MAG: DUF362 domain-containing protein [Candidatus Shapirobacteria bacterium]|nr:DUF362 domain-containing protein [Candidatus Shapirobacteria bacterium]
MNKTSQVYQIFWSDYQKNPAKITVALEKIQTSLVEPVAVKTHFGEPGNNNALRGKIVKPAIGWLINQNLEGFLTDTNTLYTGQRSNTKSHLETAKKHGFADLGLPIIIAKEDDFEFKLVKLPNRYQNLPIYLGKELREAKSIFCLSHVKGHPMFGFGGALKNLGMGGATPRGKRILHASTIGKIDYNRCLVCGLCTENCPTEAIKKEGGKKIVIDYEKCIGCGECVAVCPQKAIEINKEDLEICQEKTAVYAWALVKEKPSLYINYLIKINAVCDCFSSTSPKLMEDLGVLISDDPVAVDQASLDWINRKSGQDLFLEVNKINYQPILNMGEKIGLGTTKYQLQKI